MAKFPVNPGDSDSAVTDAINTLLSGPSGLGQNFQGFSSGTVNDAPPINVNAFLTGNYRPPFTQTTTASTYVAPIALATAVYLDSRTIEFTFAAPEATPPFALGNGLTTVGITPSTYDYNYSGSGVVECTTTSVTIRITGDGTTPAPGTGGTIAFNPFGGGAFVSTDANAKVTVNGGTDRVFISAQLNSVLTYRASQPSGLTYSVMINRRRGSTNDDPTNPDFVFEYDDTVAVKNYNVYTLEATETGLIVNGQTFTGTKALTTYPYTYTVIPTTLTGSGMNGILNVTLTASASAAYDYSNTDITVTGGGGYGYAIGDTLVILGSQLGGVDVVNDMNLTVTQVTTGTATLPPATFANWYSPVEIETTFTAVIDQPAIGYYWYIVELEVDSLGGDAVITQVEFGYRTLSAQVVKA